MAQATLSNVPWADGTSVSVYAGSGLAPGETSPVGSSVTSASVSSNAVTFSGLTAGGQYYAIASGIVRSFIADQARGVVYVPTVAGAVSDASFGSAPLDGAIALDVTNSKIYARVNGAWVKTAALT